MIITDAFPDLTGSTTPAITRCWERAFKQQFPDEELRFEQAVSRICPLLATMIDENLSGDVRERSKRLLRSAISEFVSESTKPAIARGSVGLLPAAIAEACGLTDPAAFGWLRVSTEFMDVAEEVSLDWERRRLRALFDSIEEAVVVVERDWRISLVNRAFFKTAAIAREAIVGLNFFSVFFHEFKASECVRESLRSVMNERRSATTRISSERGTEYEGHCFPVVGGGFILFLRILSKSQPLRAPNERAIRARRAAWPAAVILGSNHLPEAVQKLTRLVLRRFADACLVEIVGADGSRRRFDAATQIVEKQNVIDELKQVVIDRAPRPVMHEAQLVQSMSYRRLHTFAPDPDMCRLLSALEPKSLISVPLASGKRSIGQMTLVRTRARKEYDLKELRAVEQLARGAAVSIENVMFRDDLERMEHEQRFLSAASRSFSESIDLAGMLTAIENAVVPELADACIVYGIEDARLVAIAARTKDGKSAQRFKEAARAEMLTIDRCPLLFDALERKATVSCAGGECSIEALRTIDDRAVLILPLVAHQQVIGLLLLASCSPNRKYTSDVVRTTEDLAARAASALNHLRLHREAERAIRTREDVLAIVAHDLRNSLNVIRAAAELITDPAEPPEIRERTANCIVRSVGSMERLVSDLVDLAVIDSGRLALRFNACSVDELIAQALETHVASANAKQILLSAEIPANLPLLWCDRERLLQVFANYVGNAIKFCPNGASISIGVRMLGRELVFFVSDTGPGLSEEQMGHVFERFWRADRRSRRSAGLGLSICKGIVDAHGGRCSVTSQPGQGCMFSFTLPLGLPEEETVTH